MPRAIATAAGAADEQATSHAVTLCGYSVRESAATAAAAAVVIRNGTSAVAPAVAVIELAADASETVNLPTVSCPDGIFIERSAGETQVIVYVL